MIYCVQYNIQCDTENNMNNLFDAIQTAINAITTAWEDAKNKKSHTKGFDILTGEGRVSGIQRMSSEAEKTNLFNKIKGMLSPPQIRGKVKLHYCSHFGWKCLDCQHVWDSMELPPTVCPSCGNSNPISIVGAVEPCVVTEEFEVK